MVQATNVTSILIVDDDPLGRDAIARILADEGYEVKTAPTSFACLNRLNDGEEFDLIILDVLMMPGSPHGFALGRMARVRNPDQKLLYITGYGDALPSRELVVANAPILHKPLRALELVEAVKATMANSNLKPASAH